MPERFLPVAYTLCAALGSTLACRSEERPKPSPSASASERASSPPRPPAPRPSASVARPAPHGCRAIGVNGADAGAPSIGDFFGSGAWLDLPAGVDVTLRHTETAREFALRGPGRFQPCADGAESVSIARGRVTTTAGPGARPGAEVLLATPFAVIHYADARLTLELDEHKLSLRVEQGSAVVERTLATSKRETTQTVSGPAGALSISGSVDAQKLDLACSEARQAVGTKPRPQGSASAGASLGDWAANQLEARRALRFTCAQARAAVGRLTGAELSRPSGPLDGTEPEASPKADAGK